MRRAFPIGLDPRLLAIVAEYGRSKPRDDKGGEIVGELPPPTIDEIQEPAPVFHSDGRRGNRRFAKDLMGRLRRGR